MSQWPLPLLSTQKIHKPFKGFPPYTFDPRNSFQVFTLHFGFMTETQAPSWHRIGQTPCRRHQGQWSNAECWKPASTKPAVSNDQECCWPNLPRIGQQTPYRKEVDLWATFVFHILKEESNVSEPSNFCFSFLSRNLRKPRRSAAYLLKLRFSSLWVSTGRGVKTARKCRLYFNMKNWNFGIDMLGIELKKFSSAATQRLPGGGGACDKRVAQARGRERNALRWYSVSLIHRLVLPWKLLWILLLFLFLVGSINTRPPNHMPVRKWSPAAAPELVVELVHGKSCKIEH